MTYENVANINPELWEESAKKFHEILTPTDKVIMEYGMIPKHVFDPFLEMFFKMMVKRMADVLGREETMVTIPGEIKKKIEHNLCRAIYATADMIV